MQIFLRWAKQLRSIPLSRLRPWWGLMAAGFSATAMATTATEGICPANAWCGTQALAAQSAWMGIRKAPSSSPSSSQPSSAPSSLAYTKQVAKLGQKYGFPINVWAILANMANADRSPPPADLPANFIGWDSPCRHHQTSNKLILKGHGFFTQLKDLPSHLVSGSATAIDGQGKVHTWAIPAGETPILLDGPHLIFTIAFEGNYLHLKINEAGVITPGNWQLQGKRPHEVKCPAPLAQHFSAYRNNVAIFQEGFCKKIWNLATRSYQTLLFAWACD